MISNIPISQMWPLKRRTDGASLRYRMIIHLTKGNGLCNMHSWFPLTLTFLRFACLGDGPRSQHLA